MSTLEANLPGVRRLEHIMGTADHRRRSGRGGERIRPRACLRVVSRSRPVFSTFKSDSEISRLNRDELSIHAACADVREVLQRCESLRVETEGAFDVRAASSNIDPPDT